MTFPSGDLVILNCRASVLAANTKRSEFEEGDHWYRDIDDTASDQDAIGRYAERTNDKSQIEPSLTK